MAERRLKGRPASPGFAVGRLVPLAAPAMARIASGDPTTETADLRAAIVAAFAEIVALEARADGDAADMLGFQRALIEDPVLSEPAFAAVAEGAAADAAWAAALESELADYRAADDEYFRARAADLMDLRDRVLLHLSGQPHASKIPPGAVVVANDMPPSRFLEMDWSEGGAILLSGGSTTSHVAMLARSRRVPMIVGLAVDPGSVAGEALVDAESGEAILDASEQSRRAFELRRDDHARTRATWTKLLDRPAMTRNGERITVLINLSDPRELDGIDPSICDGIGLVRTEFLFQGRGGFPSEDEQYAIYRGIVDWARGRPVTMRTLDAGGDKPIAGLTLVGESNPFLGTRGIRLSLARPDVFRVQLRALIRAAAHGTLKIMLPMVAVPAELRAARDMLDEEALALARSGLAAPRPALGIMVEVPAAAIAIDMFDADFFSIGSNDLTQYVMAAGRDVGAVSSLADPLNTAVLSLVQAVAHRGRQAGREVSLCGDAAADPAAIPHLLAAGVRALSVAPAALGQVKASIASFDLTSAHEGAAA